MTRDYRSPNRLAQYLSVWRSKKKKTEKLYELHTPLGAFAQDQTKRVWDEGEGKRP